MAPAFTNLLLETLPASERLALESQAEPVRLPLGSVIYEVDTVPRYMYFLTSGVASVLTTMAGGETVEVGLVGREGLPGTIHVLGEQRGQSRCFMQIAGTGLRIEFRIFRDQFAQLPRLHQRVLQHVQHEALLLAQLSACNRVHQVENRLARWLLMVSDRIGQDDLHLTQEFLGQMLGARRSTVTLTAGALQESGMIEYRRGRIRILYRDRLEHAACECYAFTQKLLKTVYGQPRTGVR